MNLSTLNASLHAQLAVIANQELKGKELRQELERANAIKEVGKVIIDNATLAYNAQKMVVENGLTKNLQNYQLPKLLSE